MYEVLASFIMAVDYGSFIMAVHELIYTHSYKSNPQHHLSLLGFMLNVLAPLSISVILQTPYL